MSTGCLGLLGALGVVLGSWLIGGCVRGRYAAAELSGAAGRGTAAGTMPASSERLSVGGRNLFAEEMTPAGLRAGLAGRDVKGMWIQTEAWYMGTREGYHFIAFGRSVVGIRQIFRVPESEVRIANPFGLRLRESGWRRLQVSDLPDPLEEGSAAAGHGLAVPEDPGLPEAPKLRGVDLWHVEKQELWKPRDLNRPVRKAGRSEIEWKERD